MVDYEFGTFRNEAGQTIQLKIKKGSKGELMPGEVLPEGYVYVDPTATQTEAVTTTSTTPQTARVTPVSDPGKEDMEAAQQKAEEEKYGKGGASAKLGLKDFFGQGQDYIYGVNYLDGVSLSQVLTGNIPDDASIMLKNDNDEVLLTGAEYKIMSKEVKAPGTNYNETRDIIEQGRVRAGEAAQQRFLESLEKDDDDKDEDEDTKYTLTKKQLDDYAKSYGGITDFDFSGGFEDSSPPPPPKPKPKPAPAPVYQEPERDDPSATPEGNQYDFSSPTEKSTREDRFGEAGKYMKDGGLASKPKPKTKKMKRGGLASKK